MLAFLLLGGFCALFRFGVVRHVYEHLALSRRAGLAAPVGGGISIPFFQLYAQRAMEPAVVDIFGMLNLGRIREW